MLIPDRSLGRKAMLSSPSQASLSDLIPPKFLEEIRKVQEIFTTWLKKAEEFISTLYNFFANPNMSSEAPLLGEQPQLPKNIQEESFEALHLKYSSESLPPSTIFSTLPIYSLSPESEDEVKKEEKTFKKLIEKTAQKIFPSSEKISSLEEEITKRFKEQIKNFPHMDPEYSKETITGIGEDLSKEFEQVENELEQIRAEKEKVAIMDKPQLLFSALDLQPLQEKHFLGSDPLAYLDLPPKKELVEKKRNFSILEQLSLSFAVHMEIPTTNTTPADHLDFSPSSNPTPLDAPHLINMASTLLANGVNLLTQNPITEEIEKRFKEHLDQYPDEEKWMNDAALERIQKEVEKEMSESSKKQKPQDSDSPKSPIAKMPTSPAANLQELTKRGKSSLSKINGAIDPSQDLTQTNSPTAAENIADQNDHNSIMSNVGQTGEDKTE